MQIQSNAWWVKVLALIPTSPHIHAILRYQLDVLKYNSILKWSTLEYSISACSDAKLYWTLGDPMDCSLTGSSVHGISQARIMEWLPFPSPRDLLHPGIELRFPALPADSLPLNHPLKPNPLLGFD